MKLLFLAILSILTGSLYAQEKFIEVTVSDTVLAKADVLIYRLGLSSYAVSMAEASRYDTAHSGPAGPRLDQVQYHFDSLVASIQQKGYTIMPLSAQDTFQINELGMAIKTRRILAHSLDELSALYQSIRNEPFITASVEMVLSDQMPYQKALYKKLMGEATSRAQSIASLAHRPLGMIISVQEKNSEKTAGGWTSYPPLSAMRDVEAPGWHTTIYPTVQILSTDAKINTLVPIANMLTVRFAME